ncbi:C2 domain containing protein [Tritrichomonas foetus]|uniref:C2 domain containing protein n=1 Tax=Tritrichomonas foetus TaxID=1144522 RepID=A0A1J4JCA6_9EUKA|nr:C2 domain containing protein [Tritrichomonas foetus]|eukprot:OHS96297.1 C2 domain containing protein [Tritrichomonas foetus]
MDVVGKSDPYVVAGVIGVNDPKTTKHVNNTDAPRWNEVLTIKYKDQLNDKLKIVMYDKDNVSDDDPIATLEIPLNTVDNEKGIDQWYKMTPVKGVKDTKEGIKIHLAIHF